MLEAELQVLNKRKRRTRHITRQIKQIKENVSLIFLVWSRSCKIKEEISLITKKNAEVACVAGNRRKYFFYFLGICRFRQNRSKNFV